MDSSYILITDDLNLAIQDLDINNLDSRLFLKDDFGINDAKDVINESYISSKNLKTIIIAANKFNIYAQNALLKILEEPPNNIKFIIIAKSKSALLPTILSRMIVINSKKSAKVSEFEIDLKSLSLKNVNEFIKSLNSSLSRDEIGGMIGSLLFSVKTHDLNLDSNELNYFSNAIKQNEFYENPKYIFLQLLLMLLIHKRKPKKENQIYK